ncbi:MAG: transketolase C-terminal domain-containing protein [Oscillospiraceae bacterium]|nr:transketolase C-terminal domain-containing protein [Oscillospiraceae bacterium]
MTKAIREVYGEALVKYGKDNRSVVVLDADVSGSTRSAIFGYACPDRFLNVGIAEANMTAMAAGLASVGKIPFVNTFAVFLTSIGLAPARAFGSYSQIPIKMVGAYGGVSDAFDGPSHHSLEDIATMRALPNFQVFVPCDAVETDWLVRYAIDTPKPMYLRMSRDAFPDVYREGEQFACGKGKVVREGDDVTIIACGLMVGNALAAAELLQQDGISARVVDMFCIKPIDRELIVRCAKETGAIVSAEEHTVLGGLGGAVAEVLCAEDAAVPMQFVGMADCHAECGPYEKLQEKYGLDADTIAAKAKAAVAEKE